MKTLRVSLADLEGQPHGSHHANTNVAVTARYTGPVTLADGQIVPAAIKTKQLSTGTTGYVEFEVYASDDPDVHADWRGFAIIVTATITHARSGKQLGQVARTVKVLSSHAPPVALGSLEPAEGKPHEYVSVAEMQAALRADLASDLNTPGTPAYDALVAAAGTITDPQIASQIASPNTATGAALRDRQPVVNVKDYGAKGDTILDSSNSYVSGTDDTAAITAALIAAKTRGARVLFPRGIYYLASSVTHTGTLDLEGQDATLYSNGTYAINASSSAADALAGEAATVVGIGLCSAKAAAAAANRYGLSLVGYSKVLVDRCEVRNANEYPLRISGCRNVVVTRSRFLSCNTSTGDEDYLCRYIHMVDSEDIAVTDNYFTSTITGAAVVDGYRGISGIPAFAGVSVMAHHCKRITYSRNRIYDAGGLEAYSECDDITIVDNRIEKVHRYAVKVDESSNVRIARNTFKDAYASAYRFLIGVTPYARTESYGSTVRRRRNLVVEDNVIDNCPQPYLITIAGRAVAGVTSRPGMADATQADMLAYGVRVSGNDLRNSPCKMPIYVVYPADALITNNTIDNCPMSAVGGDIGVYNLGDRAEITLNRITLSNGATTTIGIYLAAPGGYTGPEAWAQIERNTLVNTSASPAATYGIDFTSLPRVRIRENRIKNFNQYIFARSGGDLLINDNDGPKTTNSVVTTASFTKVTSDLTA